MYRTSDALFAAMRAIVEAPGFPFLSSYKTDFYNYDHAYLAANYTLAATFVWIVRACGTHLFPVGVDVKFTEHMEAVFNCYEETAMVVYLIHRGTLKRVSVKRARAVMANPAYTTYQGVVSKHGVAMAAIAVNIGYKDGARTAHTVIKSVREQMRYSLDELISLQMIAEWEIVRKTQSLFGPPGPIEFDGVDINTAIAEARGIPRQELAQPIAA